MPRRMIRITPKVSVIMPVRNGSVFMRQAIDSILTQSYRNFELLIVDDVSTDETWQILQEYKKANPQKIRLFQTKHNVGAFAAANIAYPHTRGKYIAPMDSDDIAHEERLTKQVAFLENHPDIVLISSYARIIDENGIVTGFKRYPTDHEGIYQQFALVNPIVHPACMIRKSALPKKALLYHTNYGVNSDYYTLFSLLQYGKFANIPEYLLFYRIHSNNSSLQNLKEKFYLTSQIRLAAVKNFNYQFPLSAIPKVIIQHIIVLLTPASLLLPLYLIMRGMRQPELPRQLNLSYVTTGFKRYALVPMFIILAKVARLLQSQ